MNALNSSKEPMKYINKDVIVIIVPVTHKTTSPFGKRVWWAGLKGGW